MNELRRIAFTEPSESVAFNGSVINLFDAGFVVTQATAIRRLIEKSKSDPKLAVISLRSVLADIEESRHLITRENCVCLDGLPYDYETVSQQWVSALPSNSDGVHVRWLPTSGPTAWHMSEWSCPYKAGHPSNVMPVFYTPSVTPSSIPYGDDIHYSPRTRMKAIPLRFVHRVRYG